MKVTDCRGKVAREPDARYISHPVDAAAAVAAAAVAAAVDWSPEAVHCVGAHAMFCSLFPT